MQTLGQALYVVSGDAQPKIQYLPDSPSLCDSIKNYISPNAKETEGRRWSYLPFVPAPATSLKVQPSSPLRVQVFYQSHPTVAQAHVCSLAATRLDCLDLLKDKKSGSDARLYDHGFELIEYQGQLGRAFSAQPEVRKAARGFGDGFFRRLGPHFKLIQPSIP